MAALANDLQAAVEKYHERCRRLVGLDESASSSQVEYLYVADDPVLGSMDAGSDPALEGLPRFPRPAPSDLPVYAQDDSASSATDFTYRSHGNWDLIRDVTQEVLSARRDSGASAVL